MAESKNDKMPGVSAAAVTKGRAGVFNSAGKIAEAGANAKPDGIIGRTTTAADEATYLEWGLVNITSSEAITAGAELTTAAAGKFEQSDAAASEWVAGHALQTAATAADESIPALIYPPGGGYVKA